MNLVEMQIIIEIFMIDKLSKNNKNRFNVKITF